VNVLIEIQIHEKLLITEINLSDHMAKYFELPPRIFDRSF
jgi:hypothetical protein